MYLSHRIYFFLLICVQTWCINAQVFENIPLVTVYRESKIDVKPDVVVLRVNASRYLTAADLQSFTTKQNIQLKMKFVESEKVEIVDDIESYKKDNTGYLFVQEFTLTIRDYKAYSEIVMKLYQNGFYDFQVVDFQVSKLDELKEKARLSAVKNARSKATSLATELGQAIGKAHRIDEIEVSFNSAYPSEIKINKPELWFPLNDNYPIKLGYISIIAKVKVSFDLKK